jgi:hypothetical protein
MICNNGSKRRKRKNDRIDANKLARLGRVDPESLYPIQHRSREVRQDQVMLRARDALVAARTEIINTTRGLIKSMGTRLPKCSSRSFAQRDKKQFPWKYAKRCCPWCVRHAVCPYFSRPSSSIFLSYSLISALSVAVKTIVQLIAATTPQPDSRCNSRRLSTSKDQKLFLPEERPRERRTLGHCDDALC